MLPQLLCVLLLVARSWQAQPLDFEYEVDETTTLFVDSNNPHCDFSRMNGPVCDLTGVDATLVVPLGFNLPDILELEVYNATSVVLYPVCLPWVQVSFLGGLTTPHVKNASSASSCRTWLRAYSSHLDSLTNGLLDVSLVETSVGIINLHDMRDFMAISSNISLIEHMNWQGYSGLIVSSRIREIMSLHSGDDLNMINNTIGKIYGNGFLFSGDELVVNNTKFQHIMSKAIHIRTGRASFANTTFRQVAKHGIAVKPGAHLLLHDVAIEHCVEPCIVIPYESAAEFINVTVAGQALNANGKAVLYSEYDESTTVARHLNSYTQCKTQKDKIVCDFTGYTEPVYLLSFDDLTNYDVILSSVSSLHVINACNLRLFVNDSKVSYSLSKLDPQGEPSSDCPSAGSLTAFNTTFNMIVAKHLKSLTLINSKVREILVDTIEYVEVRNNTKMTLTSTIVNGSTVLENSTVALLNTNLKGWLRAVNVNFTNVINLTIGANDVNSTISHSMFGFMHRDLNVHGSLILNNVVFGWFRLYPINLMETATLYLNDTFFVQRNGGQSIWVDRREQVVWLNQSERNPQLVHVRHRSTTPGTTLAGPGQPDCSALRPHFTFIFNTPRDYTCNYTAKQTNQSVSVQRSNSPYILRIVGAQHVDLSNICSLTIILRSVASSNMVDADGPCEYSLIGYDSNFKTIVNDPTKLTLERSSVDRVQTYSVLKRMTLTNTVIGTLNASVNNVILDRANITKIIDKLTVTYYAVFDKSQIECIGNLEVGIMGVIKNSRINSIRSKGVHIKTKMIIENVTIGIMEENAVVIEKGGILVMNNVTIEEGWLTSFNHSAGYIDLAKVTLNGIELEKLDSLKTMNIGVIESSSTTMDLVTTPIKIKTLTYTQSSEVDPSSTSPVPDNTGSLRGAERAMTPNTGGQAWKHWAAAGASIFLGLSIIVASMSVVIAVRSHKRGENFTVGVTRFMGRRYGDDTAALATELDMTGDTTHYSRLPSL